jgi:hypothetical protein
MAHVDREQYIHRKFKVGDKVRYWKSRVGCFSGVWVVSSVHPFCSPQTISLKQGDEKIYSMYSWAFDPIEPTFDPSDKSYKELFI